MRPPVPVPELQIGLDLDKPFHTDSPWGQATGIAHVSFQTPLRPNVGFFAGLSVAYADSDLRPIDVTVSNAAFRILFGTEESFVALRVSFPFARAFLGDAGYSSEPALAADLLHPERFVPNAKSFGLEGNRHVWSDGRRVLGARVGFLVMTPSGFKAQLFGRYGAFLESSHGPVLFRTDVAGSTIVSGDTGDVAERSVAYFTATVGPVEAGHWPRLYFRVPLERQTQRALEALVGLGFVF